MAGPLNSISRRRFVRVAAAASLGLLAGSAAVADDAARPPQRLKLGFDNFSLRSMDWKAPALIDYAAELKVDSLFISDLNALESLEASHLGKLRARAVDRGLQIHVGAWSICPTARQFKKDWGTAAELLTLGIRVAKDLGSPVLRVILGTHEDRLSAGGIEARIKDTVAVLQEAKTRAQDAGVRIAMENHAGDMHSRELVQLIEAAGKDFVGANIDSGNAAWALEEPLSNLEILAPYALTTSLRDTAVWPSQHGVTAQWTAMGDGMVDWKKYFTRFAELCPDTPVHIETISGFPRELRVNDEQFWQGWPQGKPAGYDRFITWAATGQARKPHKLPEGVDKKLAQQRYEREELEQSLRYCKSLGLGRRNA